MNSLILSQSKILQTFLTFYCIATYDHLQNDVEDVLARQYFLITTLSLS